MSIIFNGTTLDSSADITYNGTSLNKIVFNGVEVWKKYPSIKDIIKINLGDNYGTKMFKVLNISGSIAEVMLLNTKSLLEYKHNFNDSSVTTTFTGSVTTGQKYADSALDNYLNNTWYSGLSDEIKTAIVQKDITQDMWNMKYSESMGANYTYGEKLFGYNGIFSVLYGDHGTVPIGDRNIYALSVTEIFEYLNVTVTDSDKIRDMFWKYEHNNIWLRSAGNYGEGAIFLDYTTKGFYSHVYSKTYAVRPAFQIDLSQVNWSVSIL